MKKLALLLSTITLYTVIHAGLSTDEPTSGFGRRSRGSATRPEMTSISGNGTGTGRQARSRTNGGSTGARTTAGSRALSTGVTAGGYEYIGQVSHGGRSWIVLHQGGVQDAPYYLVSINPQGGAHGFPSADVIAAQGSATRTGEGTYLGQVKGIYLHALML